MWADFFRLAAIVEIGIMAGLMIMILYTASKVLRPSAKTTGFLLWHIISIALGVTLVVAVGADSVISRVGEPVTWRGPVFFAGLTAINVALIIIFRVELRRWQRKRSG